MKKVFAITVLTILLLAGCSSDFSSGHFWYSQNQKAVRIMQRDPTVYCKINGVRKEYTEWTQTKRYSSNWKDVEYLGKGHYDGT